jgi:two-component system OmpR family sensor kinase
MSSPFQSIRWRVQAWHGLILLIAVAAFCLTAYQLAWDNQLRQIDRALGTTERSLVHALMMSLESKNAGGATAEGGNQKNETLPSNPGELIGRLNEAVLPAGIASQFAGDEPGHAYFSLRNGRNELLQQSDNAPADLDYLPEPETETDIAEEFRTIGHRRELARSAAIGLRGVVGRDITPELQERTRFIGSLVAIGGGIWIVGLFGGWWFAGRAIRPIETISQTASRIVEGNLQERIHVQGTDSELDQLGSVLNQTFDRLYQAIERQKQFTADASHELRTPLTILLNETQRMLKRAERSPEEYRAALHTCQTAAQRMHQLTESLILLARQDSFASPPANGKVSLDEVIRHCLTQMQPLADAKGLHLNAELHPVTCTGDSEAFRVLVSNLIGNAIHHHDREGGQVRVACSVASDGHSAELRVADDGPGISPDDLPHIFDRFYRADKARASSGVHSGLGLAIVKGITNLYGARINVTSTLGKGTDFTVSFLIRTDDD